MSPRSAPIELENDPRNRCIGCGPDHPTGLRLAFRREGEAVTTVLAASDQREGWPGRLHSGMLYLALLETSNWTVFGLLGRVGLPVETSALELKRWVATGEQLRLEGRLAPSEGPRVRVQVEAMDGQTTSIASLSRAYDLPSREQFLKRMGYTAVPPGLVELLPE